MAVTRQEYSIEPTWTGAQVADTLVGPAFISAGLMTNWHDSFTISDRNYRVLETVFDNTKTYGKMYYLFQFKNNGEISVCCYTGWDATNNIPTGTQFLDYHLVPNDINGQFDSRPSTGLGQFTTTTRLTFVRYSSQDNPKQSWFIFRQGTTNGTPFTVLHPTTQLYAHLNLNLGCICGFQFCVTSVNNRSGFIHFELAENIRRQLCIGAALNGNVEVTFGNDVYHDINFITHRYQGIGRFTNSHGTNINRGTGSIPLPIGHSGSNPAYTTNYSPICTDLPWTIWTSEPLATDFGVYMHYADNNITYNDRFVVTPGVEEWEVISFANNATVDFGASACFVARVV